MFVAFLYSLSISGSGVESFKSKEEFQYLMNLPYSTEVQKDISNLLFVQNKDINIK